MAMWRPLKKDWRRFRRPNQEQVIGDFVHKIRDGLVIGIDPGDGVSCVVLERRERAPS